MKFLKIAMTLVLSASVISLASAPEPKKPDSQLLTISTPMVITVGR